MTKVAFLRDFPFWGANPHCKLCALVLYVFKAGRTVEVGEDAAEAAIKAGAGYRVEDYEETLA